MPCLTWICRNQSPIYKYFEIQFFAPQPIRTQRESYQAPADGTQLELAFYQLFSSDCDVLHSNYGERLKLSILYPSSTSNCFFSLTRPIYGMFFLFGSYKPDSLCTHVCRGRFPSCHPLPPYPVLKGTPPSFWLLYAWRHPLIQFRT